ncbi:MAG: RES family NAD+ phosphorylase [Undibacterium sp.]|nr:RES family NAD+ phosphorylase [Undibacterium sp.]
MQSIFSDLSVVDVHQDLMRNIVSIHSSQNLFDDLSTEPHDWSLAQQVEDEVKPLSYQSSTPIIHRPFEDAHWFNAIAWPFAHWQASRYSDGSFGVWYGADIAETTIFETAYHWFKGLLGDAGFEHQQVTIERKLYAVACDAALLDIRAKSQEHTQLMHKSDYLYSQAVGARLHREGHPGLVTQSVRYPAGHNYVILNPKVLSNPRHHCQVHYRLQGHYILVEKQPDQPWLEIDTRRF